VGERTWEPDAIIEAVWQEIHDSTLDGAESTPLTAALVALYEAVLHERCPLPVTQAARNAVTAILKEAEHE